MNKTVIIQASSRSEGNTNKIVNHLNKDGKFDIIDLSTKNIGHFDYNFKNERDDFIPLMKDIITNYDTLIFATPVYWYTMSGVLKVFFDRISDFLHVEKKFGRQLRGKNMAMLSCGSDATTIEEFNKPFIRSAAYLGMEYLGDVHTWISEENIPHQVQLNIEAFRASLAKTSLVK
jgi:multimeric flavodoxin WrbA